jgi:hypothetical protein
VPCSSLLLGGMVGCLRGVNRSSRPSRPRAKVTAQVCCLGVTVQASTRSPYQVGGVVIGRCELGAIGSADWSWPDIRGEAGGHPRGLG